MVAVIIFSINRNTYSAAAHCTECCVISEIVSFAFCCKWWTMLIIICIIRKGVLRHCKNSLFPEQERYVQFDLHDPSARWVTVWKFLGHFVTFLLNMSIRLPPDINLIIEIIRCVFRIRCLMLSQQLKFNCRLCIKEQIVTYRVIFENTKLHV